MFPSLNSLFTIFVEQMEAADVEEEIEAIAHRWFGSGV